MTNGDLFNGRKMFDSDNQYLPICLVCVCVCVRCAGVRACVHVRAYVRGVCVRGLMTMGERFIRTRNSKEKLYKTTGNVV